MRVLVVGGTGFIGRNVVPTLGWPIRVLVHRQRPDWIPAGCETVRGDVLDTESLRRAMAGVEAVINLTGQNTGSMDEVSRINRIGAANAAEAARAEGVHHLVHLSTAQVYGEQEASTEATPVAPVSQYAREKLAAEEALGRLRETGTLVILRLTNVYGPHQRNGFLGRLARAALNGLPITVNGDGAQRRDFVYVDDVGRAIRQAITVPVESGVFNIGSGVTRSVLEVLTIVEDLLGWRVPRELRPSADSGVKVNGVSIARAKAVLGFEPSVDLRNGLRMVLDSAGRGEQT